MTVSTQQIPGKRTTHARRTVVEFLRKAGQPMSATEIFLSVRSRGIDRSSVFRTLRLLAQDDFVLTTENAWHVQLYEWRPRRHHHHLHCEVCGLTTPIACFLTSTLLRTVQKSGHFSTVRHDADLYGTCAACAGTVHHRRDVRS